MIKTILKRIKTRKLSAAERIVYGASGVVLLLSAALGHNEIITYIAANLQNIDLAAIINSD